MNNEERYQYFVNYAVELWPNQYETEDDKYNATAKYFNQPSLEQTLEDHGASLDKSNELKDNFIKPVDY